MTRALVDGLLAGYGIAIPVGAVAVALVALTARTSFAVGAGAGLGVATADGGYAAAAVLGGAALAGAIEPFAVPLRRLSVGVLVVMAVVIAGRAGWRYRATAGAGAVGSGAVGSRAGTPLGAYAAFLGITALNPLTMVYFVALVLGSGTRLAAGAEAVGFVTAAFAASASWQLLLAGGGVLLGRLVATPRGRLVTALASSAVVVVLAVRVAGGAGG